MRFFSINIKLKSRIKRRIEKKYVGRENYRKKKILEEEDDKEKRYQKRDEICFITFLISLYFNFIK